MLSIYNLHSDQTPLREISPVALGRVADGNMPDVAAKLHAELSYDTAAGLLWKQCWDPVLGIEICQKVPNILMR